MYHIDIMNDSNIIMFDTKRVIIISRIPFSMCRHGAASLAVSGQTANGLPLVSSVVILCITISTLQRNSRRALLYRNNICIIILLQHMHYYIVTTY